MEKDGLFRRYATNIDYNLDFEKISNFIRYFPTDNGEPKYISEVKRSDVRIELDDVVLFDETGLAHRIESNVMTYYGIFQRAIDDILLDGDVFMEDDEDVFFYHRVARLKEKHPDRRVADVLPPELLRSYVITFIPRSKRTMSVREVGSGCIGRLVSVRGLVTKVSQVTPSILVCTYVCESCGSETYQTVTGDAYSPLTECLSDKCKMRLQKGTLHLQTRGSKFVRMQSSKVQELTRDVPRGDVPAMLDVECYGKVADVRPGDYVVITGVFLPKPYYGLKRVLAGLVTDSFFYAMEISARSYFSAEIYGDSYLPVSRNDNPIVGWTVRDLAERMAPEIYGQSDVKEVLLLALVGCYPITRKDGMRIRGDINVLLLGDPGVAKSQLLKTVNRISGRGVYTTGKGTTGVGLTASVIKDGVTGELVLEGGALVLSDGGVCCVDELDKMNETDRVSIHEVMEQQIVSISKAGINTTLNARCAMVTAANPVGGSFNPKKSVEQNTGLPVSLLSRFDVLVVMRDESDMEKNFEMARHMTASHMDKKQTDYNSVSSYEEIRSIIDLAKKLNPSISENVRRRFIDAYIDMRATNENITPRYLLSMIRLAVAHCRIRSALSNAPCEFVLSEDVNEAVRLLTSCKGASLGISEDNMRKRAIYNRICAMEGEIVDGRKVLNINKVHEELSSFGKDDINSVIDMYIKVTTWALEGDNLVILEG